MAKNEKTAQVEKNFEIIDMHQHLPSADVKGERMLEAMDRAGIRRCVLHALPEKVVYMASNKQILDVIQHRPERFVGSIYIDPRYGQKAIEQIGTFHDYGIRFIKMIPAFGYYPDDGALFPVFQAAEDRKMAILFHMGFITANHKEEERAAGIYLQSKYGEPFRLDLPARRFGGCKLIIAHMGAPWYYQAFFMSKYHDNVYADCCGTGKFAFEEIRGKSFSPDWDKIFWGNDGPAEKYEKKLSSLSECMAEYCPGGVEEKILRANPVSFLKELGIG